MLHTNYLKLLTNASHSSLKLEVCGYTRTRGFTRTRPVPAGTGRAGLAFHGYVPVTGTCATGTGTTGIPAVQAKFDNLRSDVIH
jgi:hypothetical protein